MMGYGIIAVSGNHMQFVDAGTVHNTSSHMPDRLKRIFECLDSLIKHHQPTEAAVEQVFMAVNPDSALKLGQARGAAIAALVTNNLTVAEYSARQIKQSVVGFGAASKEQVQQMVCRILGLAIVPAADAADALAAAICHAHTHSTLLKLGAADPNKLLLLQGMRKGRSRRR